MEYCKGCHAKCAHYIKHKRNDARIQTPSECPCIKCLIKAVCDIECPEYSTFFKRSMRTVKMK